MERSRRTHTNLIAIAVVLTASGACGSAFERERLETRTEPTEAKSQPPPSAPRLQEMMSIADVAEKAVQSVVNISTKKRVRTRAQPRQFPFFDPRFKRYFFDQRGQMPQGSQPREREVELGRGSGVIVGSNGVILTNNHVIENADEVVVTLADKRELKAKVVGKDPPSDLAVLELEDPPDDLVALDFGNSDRLRLGEVVVAIGNPFGVGQTVTMGIVSAKGRANVGLADYEDFIQTDAAINPGNSGGALLDLHGRLVGINTAILSRSGGNQGIGFAIPANMARSIMDSLLTDGKVVRGFLGVMIQDLTAELANAMDVDTTRGVVVSEVVDDSPAQKAGLEAGDVILRVDGVEVATSAKLRNLIAARGAGSEVRIDLVRDGDEKTVTVELTQKKGAGGKVALDEDEGPLGGVTVEPLSSELRERFEISSRLKNGVVVTKVAGDSGAAKAGLRPGDVIVGVNREQIDDPEDLAEAYESAKRSVLLRIHRGSGALFLVLKK